MLTKNEIREFILNKRKCLSDDFIKLNSQIIIENIIKLQEFKKAKNIGLFSSLFGEPDLFNLLSIFKDKNFYFPKIVGNELVFLQVKSINDLKQGVFGILEPYNYNEKLPKFELDLIFIPGIAFTLDGKRIGFGRGYYDRFLKLNNIFKIGICFDFQVFNDLFQDEWDVKMDKVIYK